MDTVMPSIPAAKQMRDLLRDLLGRDVDVAPGDPYAPEGTERATIAVYVDDQLRTRAVAAADLRFSAYAGTAIGLIPVGGAEVALEDGELSPTLAENLYEVLNVAASLFNSENSPHVKLYAVYSPGELPPIDVSGFVRVLGRRLDLVVDISGYGQGRLSIVGVA